MITKFDFKGIAANQQSLLDLVEIGSKRKLKEIIEEYGVGIVRIQFPVSPLNGPPQLAVLDKSGELIMKYAEDWANQYVKSIIVFRVLEITVKDLLIENLTNLNEQPFSVTIYPPHKIEEDKLLLDSARKPDLIEDVLSDDVLENIATKEAQELLDYVEDFRKKKKWSPVYLWIVIARSCISND